MENIPSMPLPLVMGHQKEPEDKENRPLVFTKKNSSQFSVLNTLSKFS